MEPTPLTRRAFAGFLAACTLSATGCATWNKRPKPDEKDAPRPNPNDPTPTAADLVGDLARQSERLQRLDCQKIYLDVTAQGQSFSLDGWMTCEKDRKFRMTASSILGKELDLGSNSDQFWYWVKRNPDPYVYYCRHADFDKGVNLPFPFQAEWVQEVLGMGEYPDPSRFKVEVKNTGRKRTFELIEETEAQGQRVTKVTRFNDGNPRPPVPQIAGRDLYDSRGKLIAKSTVEKTQLDKRTGIVIPQVVVLEYPAQQVTLKITLERVSVNAPLPMKPEEAAKLYVRPEIRNTKAVDLARMFPANPASNLRQAGGRVGE